MSHVLEHSPRALHRLRYFSPLPDEKERATISQHIKDQDQDPEELNGITQGAKERTRKKLAAIGLTKRDYWKIWYAFAINDVITLSTVNKRAESEIASQRTGVPATIEQYSLGEDEDGRHMYTPERQALHDEIVAQAFVDKSVPEEPHLLILTGPPGAGKSRIKERFIKTHEGTIFADPDAIRHHLIQDFDPTNNAHVQATYQESYDIADKIFRKAVEGGYSIVHEGTLRSLEGYGKTGIGATRAIDACEGSNKGYTIETVFVSSPLAECFRRSIVYRERAVTLDVLLHSADGFENFLTLREDPRINSATIIDNALDGRSAGRVVTEPAEIAQLTQYYNHFRNGREKKSVTC